MRSRDALLAAVLVVGVAACVTQTSSVRSPERPSASFGHPISEADVAGWNIDIRTTDGRGLPPGRGTVAQGKAVYEAKWVACHGPDAKGGAMYGTMVGGIGSFTTNTRVLTPGSMYPYAPMLFDYVRRSMPMDRPLSMTADEVYAVSAYILNLNGLVPADGVLAQATLPKVQMPNRHNFALADRPATSAAALDAVLTVRERYTSAGYGHGHRAALLLANRPEFFFHYLALNALGCSIVPINPGYRHDEMLYQMEHSGADLVVVMAARVAALEAIGRERPAPLPVIAPERTPKTVTKPPPAP